MQTTSKFGKLNIRDLVIGVLVMIFGSFAGGVTEAINILMVNKQPLVFNWAFFQPMIWAALVSGLGYLTAALGINSKGEILKKE